LCIISEKCCVDSTDKTTPDSVLVIYSSPLKFALYNDGVLQITINERELMHYEQQKISNSEVKAAAAIGQSDAERHGGKEVVDYEEDGLATYADGSREEKRVTGDAQIDQVLKTNRNDDDFDGQFS
jgi:hypothetical protein